MLRSQVVLSFSAHSSSLGGSADVVLWSRIRIRSVSVCLCGGWGGGIKGLHKPALGDPLNPTFVIMARSGPWPYFYPCYAARRAAVTHPPPSDICALRGLQVNWYILPVRFQGVHNSFHLHSL